MRRHSIYLFKRSNGVWYILDKRHGNSIWRSTGHTERRIAAKILREYLALHTTNPPEMVTVPIAIDIPKEERTQVHENISTLTLEKFEQEFVEYAMHNYSEGSRDIFRRALSFLKELSGNIPLTAMNMRLIDRFKTGRLKTRSAVSVNIELRSLRTFMATAVRWGYLDKNPFSGLKLVPVAERAPRFLELDEFNKLYKSIGQQRLREIVLFAIHTGTRRSEIVYLKWSDVYMERRVVSFESYGAFRVKAGKRRSVPLNDEVWNLLSHLRGKATCEYVFSLDGHRIDESLVTHKFKKCVTRIGIKKDIKFHSLRATFASWLVMKGVPIFSVSRLLGHSQVTTTQKYYAHLEPDTLHEVVNKITPGQSGASI